MKVLLLIVGLLLMNIHAQAKPVAPAFLIVPGQSIGKIKLGDSQETVRRKMGNPETASTEKVAALENITQRSTREGHKKVKERDVAIDVWRRPKTSGSLKVLYGGGRVIQIQVSLTGYATQFGLAVNSPMKQVVKRYRNPRILEFEILRNEILNESSALRQSQDFVPEGLALLTGIYGLNSEPWGVDTIFVHERNRLVFHHWDEQD